MQFDPENPDKYLEDLQNWHRAIEEEYGIALEDGDPEKIREVIRKKLGQRLTDFVDNLIDIADKATSDMARLNAIKFAFEFYFGKNAAAGEGDFEKMLKELTKNKEESTSDNS